MFLDYKLKLFLLSLGKLFFIVFALLLSISLVLLCFKAKQIKAKIEELEKTASKTREAISLQNFLTKALVLPVLLSALRNKSFLDGFMGTFSLYNRLSSFVKGEGEDAQAQ